MKNRFHSLIIVLVTSLALLFGACANSNVERIKLGESINDLSKKNVEPYYSYAMMQIFQWSDDYQVITWSDDWHVKSSVEFTFDRKSYNQQNIEPLKERSDWQRFIGMSINEVEAELGEFHCNIGAGQYAPAYIMEDAYLIYFDSVVPPEGNTNGEGIVTRVTKLDLFATKTTIVEKYE